MSKIEIDVDLLRKLLNEAYDAGWHGARELKEEAVEAILTRHSEELKAKDQVQTTPSSSPFNFNVPDTIFIGQPNENITITIDPDLWRNASDG